MLASEPTCIVFVAATIFLAVVGPLSLCLLVLLTTGLLLLVLLTLFLVLLSPGLLLLLLLLALSLPLLILICGLRLLLLLFLLLLLLLLLALSLPLLILICGLRLLLLLFLLLFLLAPGLLLFLFGRLSFLLFPRFGLLLLFFGFGPLVLLSVGGSNGSEKKDQNSHTDKPHWFHKCSLHHDGFLRHSSSRAWLLFPAVVARR